MKKNRNRIWKKWGGVAALTLFVMIGLCIFGSGAALAAGNGNGYVKCAGSHGGTTFVYSDTVGGTKLAKTSLIQFIYAGADGIVQPPDTSGNPTGDDSLITPPGTGTVGTPWNTDGEFFYFIDNMTDNAKIYVRAWNAATVTAATKYGDSSVYTINGGSPKPTPFTWNVPNFATDKTKPVLTPSLSSATPPSAYKGDILTSVALVGVNTHFAAGTSTASFGSNITVGSTSVTDATHATANTVTVNCSAATGARSVTVTTGGENASGNVFTVNAPSISNISPNNGDQGWSNVVITITGTGSHFINGTTTVGFSGTGITVLSTVVNSPTQVVVTINIDATATAGARTVTVATNLGARGTETLTTSFTVNSLTPTINRSPATLTFNAQQGGSNPADQQISISNGGQGTLNWTVSKTQSWLTLNPTSGQNSGTVTCSVNIAGMTVAGSPYNDTITIAAPGASNTPQTVAVTVNISTVPPPTLTSAAPSSGKQGETLTTVVITGQNTNFTAASTVDFGSGITHGTVTRDSATQLTVSNVVIDSGATTGTRTVTVTTGTEIANGQIFTVNPSTPPTSVVIDDYEGSCVSSYYNDNFAGTGTPVPTMTRVTTDKHEGSYSMNTTYGAGAASPNDWRGWGGVLTSTKDCSSTDTISFWMKGDGSSNKVKIQFKDADGSNYALGDVDAVSLSNTSWTEYKILKTRISNVVAAGTTAGLDWSKIIEYQFVFTGTSASTGVLIDYVNATVGSVSVTPHITAVTPTSGGEKTVITITGTNFQVGGGTVRFAGGGAMTEVQSTASNSLISAWADTQIVLSLPKMSAGTKTLSMVRIDGVTSDNSVTFEVTASSGGGSASHNYPNPFNPLRGEVTTFVFTPGSAANGTILIYDMTAKQAARIEWSATSTVPVTWNGKNNFDEIVGDGVYLYRIVDTGSGKMISKGKILVVNK